MCSKIGIFAGFVEIAGSLETGPNRGFREFRDAREKSPALPMIEQGVCLKKYDPVTEIPNSQSALNFTESRVMKVLFQKMTRKALPHGVCSVNLCIFYSDRVRRTERCSEKNITLLSFNETLGEYLFGSNCSILPPFA